MKTRLLLALLVVLLAPVQSMAGLIIPGKQQHEAIHSLTLTGRLPDNPFWDRLEHKFEHNPNSILHDNRVVFALLNREHKIELGQAQIDTPLFPHNHYFNNFYHRYEINAARFTYYHPFIGHLLSVHLPHPHGNPEPGGGIIGGIGHPGGNPWGNPGGNPGGGPGTVAVPEPSTLVLWGVGIAIIIPYVWWRKRRQQSGEPDGCRLAPIPIPNGLPRSR